MDIDLIRQMKSDEAKRAHDKRSRQKTLKVTVDNDGLGFRQNTPKGGIWMRKATPFCEVRGSTTFGLVSISRLITEIPDDFPIFKANVSELMQNILEATYVQSYVDSLKGRRLRVPVIVFLDENEHEHVIDGTHRIRKLHSLGRKHVNTVIIPLQVAQEYAVDFYFQKDGINWSKLTASEQLNNFPEMFM